jgi:hypothetical protein
MPEPIDTEAELYAQIRTLLEADSNWTAQIAEPNRIWLNDPEDEGFFDPEKEDTSEGDFNESILEVKSGTDSLHTAAVTLGTHSDDPPDHWVEKQSRVFRLQLMTQRLTIRQSSPLRRDSINVLRKAGPKLGLDYVTDVKVRWEETKVEHKQDDGTFRRRVVIDIYIDTETDGATLT